MKIAVAYENGMVFQHFGKCPSFLIVVSEAAKVVEKSLLETHGQGHGALVTLLKEADVDVLICGGCGMGARNALREANITLISGAAGNAEMAVDAYLDGTLYDNPAGQCHHHHDGEHNCSAHEHCHNE